MHNILLELAVHWLSRDTVKFELNIGFKRNMQKCNSISDVLASSQQIIAASCYAR